MKRCIVIVFAVFVLGLPCANAQYWVEFDSGTCLVGPPPVCVSGHWYWIEAPNLPSAGFQQLAAGQDRNSIANRNSAYYKPTEFSTDVEYETFSHGTMEGKSIGIRALVENVSASGFGYGGRFVYTGGTVEYQGFIDETKTTNMSANLYLIKY